MTPRKPNLRTAGVMTIETIVACSLLTATLSLMGPALVRSARLVNDCRDYRTALDELSNQMDVLTGLPADRLGAAVGALAPSEFAASRLPSAKLSGEIEPDGELRHIRLQLVWQTQAGERPPVTLVGWWAPEASNPAAEPRENDQ